MLDILISIFFLNTKKVYGRQEIIEYFNMDFSLKQLPQKRKRPAAKPSYGPKTARRPVQSSTPSTPKPVQNSLNGFAKDSEDTSPKVSEVTKSKLAAFSAVDSVSMRGYGNGWRDDLQFYVLVNSISVILRLWAGDNERLCAVEPR